MIVTTDEAAEWAGVSPSTIRQWVVRGHLSPLRRGAKPLRFRYDDVAACQRRLRSQDWRERIEHAADEWVACIRKDDASRQGLGVLRPESSPSSEPDLLHWRGFFMFGGPVARASATYEWGDDGLHVEVESEQDHTDAIDDVTRRVAWLFSEAVGAVNEQALRDAKA